MRMQHEEQMLLNSFGDEYQAYRQRTKRHHSSGDERHRVNCICRSLEFVCLYHLLNRTPYLEPGS